MNAPASDREGTGVAGLRCSCTTGLVATREVDGFFTAGFGFLKRRGRGVGGRDDASMSSFGVLKRVEGAAMEGDGSALVETGGSR